MADFRITKNPAGTPSPALTQPGTAKPWVQRLLAGQEFHLPPGKEFWWGAHLERFLAYARKRGQNIPVAALVGAFLEFLR